MHRGELADGTTCHSSCIFLPFLVTKFSTIFLQTGTIVPPRLQQKKDAIDKRAQLQQSLEVLELKHKSAPGSDASAHRRCSRRGVWQF